MQSKRTLRRMLAFISLINKLADWPSGCHLTAITFPKSSTPPPPFQWIKHKATLNELAILFIILSLYIKIVWLTCTTSIAARATTDWTIRGPMLDKCKRNSLKCYLYTKGKQLELYLRFFSFNLGDCYP